MVDIFLPTLHTFAMNNIFTGSWQAFRFRAVPNVIMKNPKEVDMEASSIFVECWHGRGATRKAPWRIRPPSP